MKVLVQWASEVPGGWVEVDSAVWHSLPQRPVPVGGELLDSPGYINALCVQGVIFQGHDHYAVEDTVDGGIRVTAWSDDPDDHPEPFGEVWEFYPPAPDPGLGGALNTRQFLTLFTPDGTAPRPVRTTGGRADVHRFRDRFQTPPDAVTRHGIWLPEPLYLAHGALQERRDWREWADG